MSKKTFAFNALNICLISGAARRGRTGQAARPLTVALPVREVGAEHLNRSSLSFKACQNVTANLRLSLTGAKIPCGGKNGGVEA
jgi:hypothetical protein